MMCVLQLNMRNAKSTCSSMNMRLLTMKTYEELKCFTSLIGKFVNCAWH